MAGARWIDLLDPDRATLEAQWPEDLHEGALDILLAPATHGDEPRPKFESHGHYAFAVLLVPVAVVAEDRVYYQEIDLLLTEHVVLSVRKTPDNGVPFDIAEIKAACDTVESAGMIAYRIVDEVAEGFLDLTDDVHEEIDELEDNVDTWTNDMIRRRLSELRHDLLHIRRTLGPTRDAVRRVVDNRVEVDDEQLFPHDVELHFGDAFDKLLRSTEGLESARDLIGGVRDYHQSKVANDQNEVMKRLTVIASLLLLPTFIVGNYGQNFDHMPELHWLHGYGFAWGLIVVTTILQLAFFRWKKWI